MQTSPPISATRSSFRKGVLDFLWRQWTQLGVAGTQPARDEWTIDPESLLAFSLEISRRDPRLFDEILDWLVRNASLVSTQRLWNRLREEDEPLVRASIAWTASHGAAAFRTRRQDRLDPDSFEHLFRVDGNPLHVERPDPVFERFGLLRPDTKPSGKSRPPDPLLPANLTIRLRLLFGIGTRAEVLRVLLTKGMRASTTEVTEAAGYARRNVEEALTALADARVVMGARQVGRRVWWVERERWANLLGLEVSDLPQFVDWERLFGVLRRMDQWLEDDASANRTDYMRASSARELMHNLHNDLSALGIQTPEHLDAGSAVASLEGIVGSLLSFITGSRQL